MARFTKEETLKKKAYAKDLFLKGFDEYSIADITGLTESTIKKWAKEDDFKSAKEMHLIAISEIRNTIVESFIALRNGEKPKIKPDEAAKYASAFEKLSDKKKVLSYMYEAYEMLTDEIMKEIQSATAKKDKEVVLAILKKIRTTTDVIMTRTAAEVLNKD